VKLPGVPYRPRYSTDEVVLGVTVALALHLVTIGPVVAKGLCQSSKGGYWFCARFTVPEEEMPLVARPVVQASLLKLGKPIDPKKLPDRLVPQQRTAPKQQVTASHEDPPHKKRDAGAPPPPNAHDSDIANLINKSDPFAEDAGKPRIEHGHASGSDAGTETDPNKVRAGDAYAAKLGLLFGQRLTIPSVISIGEARRLCAVFQININRNMVVWHVRQSPVRSSGNELFDDAARSMLLKLLDDRLTLPAPPPEVEELYRGRTVQVQIPGDTHGGSSACPK
jgi:hypothetical protein